MGTLPKIAAAHRSSLVAWNHAAFDNNIMAASGAGEGAGAGAAATAGAFREETDSMGVVRVPADKYFGAQSMRSMENFRVGGDSCRMPMEVIQGTWWWRSVV